MNNEIAIQIKELKKRYKLGQIGGGTLQGDLQSWWAMVRGKEDPNSKIGTNQRSNGETFMALNGINLTVYKGEALGIIGGNGAGKSTLLKILSRITAPTEGEIDIYGRIASMLEVGTGFNGEMTGRENVYMNGAILGMTKTEIDAKMEDIIEFSEVREFIDTPVKRYSSGMYVKLAFSVAAHLDSEIMIMDEVLAVGDMAFQKKCLDKMREAAKQEGRTVLYVSHNMNTIRQLCDRCVVLEKGKIVFEGDVEEAIGIYLDKNSEESLTINLDQVEREIWVPEMRIRAMKAEFINKRDIVFDGDEAIKLMIQWKCLKNVQKLSLRIEIWTMDNVTQGSYMVYDFASCRKGDTGAVELELDISKFQEATYRMVYVFFTKDEFGNNIDLDIVFGLKFKKTMLSAKKKMIWKPKNWGYIELPTPKIEKLRVNE